MTLEHVGIVDFVIQTTTVLCSLLTTLLLAWKGKERWGYLVGFVSLPLWVVMEWYYEQWLYLLLNPIYFVLWGIGLVRHWRTK